MLCVALETLVSSLLLLISRMAKETRRLYTTAMSEDSDAIKWSAVGGMLCVAFGNSISSLLLLISRVAKETEKLYTAAVSDRLKDDWRVLAGSKKRNAQRTCTGYVWELPSKTMLALSCKRESTTCIVTRCSSGGLIHSLQHNMCQLLQSRTAARNRWSCTPIVPKLRQEPGVKQ